MGIPDVLDDRPHKTGSTRSYSPNIVLDEPAVEAEMHAKSLGQDHHDEPNGVNQRLDEQIQQLDMNCDER